MDSKSTTCWYRRRQSPLGVVGDIVAVVAVVAAFLFQTPTVESLVSRHLVIMTAEKLTGQHYYYLYYCGCY